ncbi:ABC transporter ATP-binding protein [Jeotgalibacillus proteolyticus]|uniref:Peptide ABC transporter ATP-binding protein n=1 Tax=Jeotgalibacillus proteolyticus TaxID=2082395 RepID=A0A2S5GBQ7_9BACL|nr:ABC transporter ATP-binding protein [Jeotgalibacillus proteolyticus]PPA70388.1 peptide ABC transporter ATP-binding protein [Jeotgalibacillus proteolyticus]
MLNVKDVYKSYRKGGLIFSETHQIIKNVSFTCHAGECLGIIGESGSGKSTLGRLILGIEKPDSGTVLLNGQNMADRRVRAGNISAVFQDYKSSINPFYTVKDAIMEPMKRKNKTGKDGLRKIDQLLIQVGLDPSYKDRYPHELSGGEVQRVCIARAISTGPNYILLDEAISSLDVSVQTQILDLLKELKRIYNMSYVFITHDIQAAAYICDRVLIFKDGQIEELVDIDELKDVQSAYAKELFQSIISF